MADNEAFDGSCITGTSMESEKNLGQHLRNETEGISSPCFENDIEENHNELRLPPATTSVTEYNDDGPRSRNKSLVGINSSDSIPETRSHSNESVKLQTIDDIIALLGSGWWTYLFLAAAACSEFHK